mgnify:CR=1 FL=1
MKSLQRLPCRPKLVALSCVRESAKISLLLSLAVIASSCSGGDAKTAAVKPAAGGAIRAALALARASIALEPSPELAVDRLRQIPELVASAPLVLGALPAGP